MVPFYAFLEKASVRSLCRGMIDTTLDMTWDYRLPTMLGRATLLGTRELDRHVSGTDICGVVLHPSKSKRHMSERREALPLSSDPTSTSTGGGGGHPRRNLGRSARRRRKKHLELEQLERSLLLLGGTTTTAPNDDKKTKEVRHELLSGSSSLSVDRHWGGSRIAHLRHERPTQWKSPQDPVALQRQLGYVPGNAIAVATRLQDLYPSSPNNNNNNSRHGPPPLLWPTTTNSSDSASSQQPFQLLATDTPETPVVVQLYPLAWRKEHGGGKAQGCSFKSRKRKRWQQQPLDDNNKNNSKTGKEEDDTCHSTKETDAGNDNDDDNHNVPVQGTTSNDSSVPDHETDDPPYNDQETTTPTNTNSSTVVVVEPFPTMYWLTHPLLKVWVSQLEVQGMGVEFQERLNQDEPSLQRMYRAHQAYGHERLQLLLLPTTTPPPLMVSSSLQQPQEEKEGEPEGEPTDRRQTAHEKDQDNGMSPPNGSSSAHNDRITHPNNPITHQQQQQQEQPQAETEDDHPDESIRRRWSSRLENLGIAGIRNFAAVKCLHAHCAHVLSGGAGSQDNVVGHWVVEALRQRILQQQTQARAQTGVVVEAPVHTTTTTTTNKANP